MNKPILKKEPEQEINSVFPPPHNLNIHMYSLDEVIGLFNIKNASQISIEDLKNARKKVLMLHPDKSRLAPDYFLFYKKAFDIIVKYYENNNKQNQSMTEEATNYVPMNPSDFDKSTTKQINKAINGMSTGVFQQKFNEIFEKNVAIDRPNPQKNEWFSNHDPTFQIDENVSVKNMGQVLDTVKRQSQGIVKYRGVENIYSGSNQSSNFYDGDEEDDSTYVSSDPFSKLKYDDLRRVHKDQTVFSVSESDFDKVTKYASVDQFSRERDNPTGLSPLEKQQAEKLLAAKEHEFKEKMMLKQHRANMQTAQYEEKNRSILSAFLHLENI